MTRLCFAIPTWNRAKKLSRCVENIAQQIVEGQVDASIYISDNASEDETPKVIAELKRRYKFIVSVRQKENIGGLANIAHVLGHADGDYVWMMGDDDLVLPGGVKLIETQLDDDSLAVVHAGMGWFKPHTGNVYESSVIGFANRMGFNQFIGWISSDIIRKDVAEKMVSIPEWAEYQNNAFPHVCALLHVAAYEKAKVIDAPIANPMEAQNEDDIKRWADENVGWKYVLTIDSLKYLQDTSIIKEKYKPSMFKYLQFYLWDRFIVNMIAQELSGNPWPDKGWQNILMMADIIDDADMAKRIRSTCQQATSLIQQMRAMKGQIEMTQKALSTLASIVNQPVMPVTTFAGESR